MNIWLLSAALLLVVIGVVHSVLGERRIFRPWALEPPPGLRPQHRTIVRCSWHLTSLLGFGQAGALACLGAAAERPAAGLQSTLLACLAGGVLACGALVLWMTRGRHRGGTALVIAAALIAVGITSGITAGGSQ